MNILVTGSNGFVGRALVDMLVAHGHYVRGVVRSRSRISERSGAKEFVVVGHIDSETRWADALSGIDVVIHLAARVHVMSETAADPLKAFREVNAHGTEKLAKEAVKHGIKRFVYVSSIKVNGEKTGVRKFTPDEVRAPTDPYSISKAEAEMLLQRISREAAMEVVIVRPPLVYGPGVGGNFLRLMKLVNTGLPLPLGTVRNARSMVSLYNLNDMLALCVDKVEAAGQVFLVSDGIDWSTPRLIKNIACYMGKPARLLPFPPALLKLAGRLTGQVGVVDRLCDSLEIDLCKTRDLLHWVPPQSPEEGVSQAVNWYRQHKYK